MKVVSKKVRVECISGGRAWSTMPIAAERRDQMRSRISHGICKGEAIGNLTRTGMTHAGEVLVGTGSHGLKRDWVGKMSLML